MLPVADDSHLPERFARWFDARGWRLRAHQAGMIAAARGYGISMGDLLMVAEDVAQGRLSLPFPTAVASGENYYLVWPKTRPGGERLRRLSDFLQQEVAAMELPDVRRLA